MPIDRKQIPSSSVERLAVYFRELDRLVEAGSKIVSSSDLAEILHIKPTQVRKDLTYFGEFGQRGVGYDTRALHASLKRILGLCTPWPVALVGAGKLGQAFLAHEPFHYHGFEIRAAFDVAPSKIGTEVDGVGIHSMDEFEETVRAHGIRLAILAVPSEAAQESADRAVKAGICGLMNFAPVKLDVPKHVVVRQIDLTAQLKVLAFHLSDPPRP